jgi:hypothetical protein
MGQKILAIAAFRQGFAEFIQDGVTIQVGAGLVQSAGCDRRAGGGDGAMGMVIHDILLPLVCNVVYRLLNPE